MTHQLLSKTIALNGFIDGLWVCAVHTMSLNKHNYQASKSPAFHNCLICQANI